MPEDPGDGKVVSISDAPAEAAPSPNLPVYKGPLTKDGLSEYSENQLLRHANPVIPAAFRTLLRSMKKGDKDALKAAELALQVYSYVGKGSAVTIVNNVLQQNAYGTAGRVEREQEVFFESIIRKIDAEQRRAAPPVIDLEAEEEQ